MSDSESSDELFVAPFNCEVAAPPQRARGVAGLAPHQRACVEHLRERRTLLIAHTLGSGKTLTALAAAADFVARRGPASLVVVVAPKSVCPHFAAERAKHRVPIPPGQIEIVTYDRFARMHFDYTAVAERGVMAIFDEAHVMRNTRTRRALKAVEFAKHCARVVLLTATVFINAPADLHIAKLLLGGEREPGAPGYREMADTRLISSQRFGKLALLPGFTEEKFAGLVSVFRPAASSAMAERFPRQALRPVFLCMPPDYEAEYLKCALDNEESFYKNPCAFYTGVRQAANVIDSRTTSPKLRWLVEFLAAHPRKRVVVFSNFLDAGIQVLSAMIEAGALADEHARLAAAGAAPEGGPRAPEHGSITGAASAEERAAVCRAFRDGGVSLVLLSRAGGVGIELVDADAFVVMEASFNDDSEMQAIGRTIRLDAHKMRPPEERVVEVFKLCVLVRREYDVFAKTGSTQAYLQRVVQMFENGTASPGTVSIDMYLRHLCRAKSIMARAIGAELDAASITPPHADTVALERGLGEDRAKPDDFSGAPRLDRAPDPPV